MEQYKLQYDDKNLCIDEESRFLISADTIKNCIAKGTKEERLTLIWAYLNSQDYKQKPLLTAKQYSDLYYALMGSVDAEEKARFSKWGIAFKAVADYCRNVRGTLYSSLSHLYSLKAKTEIYYSLKKIEEALNMYKKEKGEAVIIDFLKGTPYTINSKGKGSIKLLKDGQTKQEIKREIIKDIVRINETTSTFKGIVEAYKQFFVVFWMEEFMPLRLKEEYNKMREEFLQEVSFSPAYNFGKEFGIELFTYDRCTDYEKMKDATYNDFKNVVLFVWSKEKK